MLLFFLPPDGERAKWVKNKTPQRRRDESQGRGNGVYPIQKNVHRRKKKHELRFNANTVVARRTLEKEQCPDAAGSIGSELPPSSPLHFVPCFNASSFCYFIRLYFSTSGHSDSESLALQGSVRASHGVGFARDAHRPLRQARPFRVTATHRIRAGELREIYALNFACFLFG